MRKGLILVGEAEQEISYSQFLAECEVIGVGDQAQGSPKPRSIRLGQLVTAHLDNVRQTVRIEDIFVNSKRVRVLSHGQKGHVKFAFIKHPEFIQINRYKRLSNVHVMLSKFLVPSYSETTKPRDQEELSVFLTRTGLFIIKDWDFLKG